ncbi:hypothetical protein ZPR_1285 [Zunongwangia profunda SM-A87]|uniref:Uncharacterized protein n=1 Tax=Zunongwangia profunda (strain DSM 18752 / CCTCC AB 206139 / SM-A87) TaxID=655815 RepID=D5BJF7_ZUNPS|nr:hypothetical protein ZPR_1285 [Zunongwangia profunda SM-A87]
MVTPVLCLCGLPRHQAGYTGQKAGHFDRGYAQIILVDA